MFWPCKASDGPLISTQTWGSRWNPVNLQPRILGCKVVVMSKWRWHRWKISLLPDMLLSWGLCSLRLGALLLPSFQATPYLSDQWACQLWLWWLDLLLWLRWGLLLWLLLGLPHHHASQGLLTGGGVVYCRGPIGIHKGLACNGIIAWSRWASQPLLWQKEPLW